MVDDEILALQSYNFGDIILHIIIKVSRHTEVSSIFSLNTVVASHSYPLRTPNITLPFSLISYRPPLPTVPPRSTPFPVFLRLDHFSYKMWNNTPRPLPRSIPQLDLLPPLPSINLATFQKIPPSRSIQFASIHDISPATVGIERLNEVREGRIGPDVFEEEDCAPGFEQGIHCVDYFFWCWD